MEFTVQSARGHLERLEQCLRAYRGRSSQPATERLEDLKAALTQAELSASNLSHRAAGDPDTQKLCRELNLMAELGRGTVRELEAVRTGS